MSEVFEGYERQYCELSANLSKNALLLLFLMERIAKWCQPNFVGRSYALTNVLAELEKRTLRAEQKKQKITEIKTGIEDAEALIRKMDLEARSLQPSVKAMLLAKLREYKSDLNNLKTEVKKKKSHLSESGFKRRVVGVWTGRYKNVYLIQVSADQKGRLLMSTERLNQSSDRIKESRRTMLETEELGVSILQDLHNQRQSLLHAGNTLHGVDDYIGKSKKVLTAMSRRMTRNKWIAGSIIASLAVAIILILYFKLLH
ncbi:hypothetical protein IFM89_026915 [Coptis chinensis]|uniref:Vesicle transport v-SNARE N-terminal domain-containing protein n=1 Tax=Coptis chinensis TaxID=261450 RepID=A0A835IVA2_9MAGN|nr:hypothetical protein IFM89_026915 [Coptis chinensis]